MSTRKQVSFILESHLDLFWLGTYRTCLERGNSILKEYLDRCERYGETYLIETVVFLQSFLAEHPEYREKVRDLWARGRIDIGSAYVDTWCNLVMGESHIRNIAEGRRWLQEELGIDSQIAVHPDLPGIIPQISQIYARAGIIGYVTARKIFHHGAIWRHRSPDGSELMFYIHPDHYSMPTLVTESDMLAADGTRRPRTITLPEMFAKFPHGTALVSGGAGDLADRQTFIDRYGKPLEDYIEEYRKIWPDVDFGFGRFTEIFKDYAADTEIPTHSGEIPSVWGVAADESVEFFQVARRIEGMLLTAERLLAYRRLLGLGTEIAHDEPWYGALDNNVFFGVRDLIPPGSEMRELWKMHIFSQDHNGGGKEAAQSEFIKRRMQDRLERYLTHIIEGSMAAIGERLPPAAGTLVFNPHSWTAKASIPLSDGDRAATLTVPPLSFMRSPVSSSPGPARRDCSTVVTADDIVLENGELALAISRRTGSLVMAKRKDAAHNWGGADALHIYAVPESGNDVTIRVDEATRLPEEFESAVISRADGDSCECRIDKRILGAPVVQYVRLLNDPEDTIEVETTILWHGQRNLQVRMTMPSSDMSAPVAFGSAFGSSHWDNVVPGSGPAKENPDEIGRDDWQKYREVLGWLRCEADDHSTISIVTHHPGFVMDQERLEAVLFRTSPSCGDADYFWENSGTLTFLFRFSLSRSREPDVANVRRSMEMLMPAVVAHVPSGAGGSAPVFSPVRILSNAVVLSAMLPDESGNGIVLRLFETNGAATTCDISFDAPVERAEEIDLLGNSTGALRLNGSTISADFRAGEIKTIRVLTGDTVGIHR